MKGFFEKEVIKKYLKIIYFSVIAINIVAFLGISFLYFKTNNTIKNVKIEEEKKAKELEEKKLAKEKANKEKGKKEKKEEKKEEKPQKTIESKKITDNFVLLNKDEFTTYNLFTKKETNLKEVELIAKTFYNFFNYDDTVENVVKVYDNFDPFTSIAGMFNPGYKNLSKEELKQKTTMKDKVRMVLRQNNIDNDFFVNIYAGELPNIRFFRFKVSVNSEGKIKVYREKIIGNIGY